MGSKERKSMTNRRVLTPEGEEMEMSLQWVFENIQAVLMGVDHVCTSLATPQVLWGKERGACTPFPRVSSLEKSLAPPHHGSLPLFVSLFLNFPSFLPSFVFGCTESLLLCSLSSCGERGLLFITVHRLLVSVASLVAEHRL